MLFSLESHEHDIICASPKRVDEKGLRPLFRGDLVDVDAICAGRYGFQGEY